MFPNIVAYSPSMYEAGEGLQSHSWLGTTDLDSREKSYLLNIYYDPGTKLDVFTNVIWLLQ